MAFSVVEEALLLRCVFSNLVLLINALFVPPPPPVVLIIGWPLTPHFDAG